MREKTIFDVKKGMPVACDGFDGDIVMEWKRKLVDDGGWCWGWKVTGKREGVVINFWYGEYPLTTKKPREGTFELVRQRIQKKIGKLGVVDTCVVEECERHELNRYGGFYNNSWLDVLEGRAKAHRKYSAPELIAGAAQHLTTRHIDPSCYERDLRVSAYERWKLRRKQRDAKLLPKPPKKKRMELTWRQKKLLKKLLREKAPFHEIYRKGNRERRV